MIEIEELKKVLHDNLKSCGTGFPWSMVLETGWDDDPKEKRWVIRDGNWNMVSHVRQGSSEAELWHFVLTMFNQDNNGFDYYYVGRLYPMSEITHDDE